MTISDISWLSVASSISSIVAVFVGVLSWVQIRDSRKSRVIIVLKSIQNVCCMVVMNTGQSPAEKITFRINKELEELIEGGKITTQFTGIIDHPFTLLSGDQKTFYLLPLSDKEKVEKLSNMVITVNGQYTDTYLSFRPTKKISEKLTYYDFITSAAVPPNELLASVKAIENATILISKNSSK